MAIDKKFTREVVLTGLTEVLFDRYAGDNTTSLPVEQKLYVNAERQVCLPALNLLSFLSAVNTESAPKLLFDPRKYRPIASAMLASTLIQPAFIPFSRKGKPIVFGSFDSDGLDEVSGIQVVRHVARLEKGIPNPKVRPMLGLPWELKFNMTILPHPDLTIEIIEKLFEEGGARLGIGTFRKAYGKFEFSW